MRKQVLRRLTLDSGLLALLLHSVPAREAPVHPAKDRVEALPTALAKADAVTQGRMSAAYGQLPLNFEANQGQTDSRVNFLSRGKGYSLFLTPTEAVLSLSDGTGEREVVQVQARRGQAATATSYPIPHSELAPRHSAVLRMKLVGGNPKPRVEGLEPLPGKVNYFLGNDPKKWHSGIATYGKVKYHDVYPAIDLVYYGRQRQLEYDLVVAPGANLKSIRMSYEGADKLEIDPQGNLVLHTASYEVVQQAPRVYQEVHGTRETIPGRYVLVESQTSGASADYSPGPSQQVAFQVEGYDPKRALVIDPVLFYSTYLGGSSRDVGFGIAVDSAGNVYVTGPTVSPDFPTQNPLQPVFAGGGFDAFVAKLNSAGTALVYSTYLGGSGLEDLVGGSIAVDSAGNAYVTGSTDSPDFPISKISHHVFGVGPVGTIIVKLNSTGSELLYSVILGEGFSSDIAVDSSGNAYVTGSTNLPNFPTQNPLQPVFGGGDFDAFVTKLNTAGSALVYSTFLGGSGNDSGNSIAVDASGNAYVTGGTASPDFPIQNPLQPAFGGGECFGTPCSDAFVAKLNAAGTALLYSTYLGGSGGDGGGGIAVDSTGNAYLTGSTSSPDFPTANPLQPIIGGLPCGEFGCPSDAFVAKLNAAGSALVYSTYLGGSGSEPIFAINIAVDASGNAYLTGDTNSPDFPTANSLQPGFGGGFADAFVTKLNVAGNALVYSTYLGGSGGDFGFGIAVDPAANAYLTGATDSPDFPTQNTLQPAFGGGAFDAFVAKIASGVLPVTIDIKPGSSVNSINPSSNGNIPVAVLTTDSFDASAVDPSTVRFGRKGKETAPLRSSLEDVDEDGDLDLVLHIETQATGLQCGDRLARLSGKTFDGQQLEGSDSVRTVGCQ